MMKKKIFVLTITAFLFLGVIFSVNAYQEYIYRWDNDGEAGSHDGCGHRTGGTVVSENATMTVSVNTTGNLLPLQPFTVSLNVLNFTEANQPQHVSGSNGRITLGMPGFKGDNALFYINGLQNQFINRGEKVDAVWGTLTSAEEFNMLAPAVAGTFVLWGVAMVAMNQSDESAYNITYVEGSISITVVAPEAPSTPEAPGIPGYALPVIVATVAVVSAVLIIKRKRHIK